MPNDALIVVQKGDHSLDYYDLHTGAERHRPALDPYPRGNGRAAGRCERVAALV